MKKFTIALDVDDVLAPCIEPGCRELGIDPRRITDWNLNKTDLTQEEKSAFLKVVCSPQFVETQRPYPGAAALIEALREEGHEVLISSAVKPHSMSARSKMLMESFPMLDPNNIMLGARKELLNVDFLLDDSPYNYGHARYFVLMKRHHNRTSKGFLSVESYEEFLSMVRQAAAVTEDRMVHVGKIGHPGIICLVGPSASGKSFICDELERNPLFKKVRAMTDRSPRSNEVQGKEYLFVSQEEFRYTEESGRLLESTVYAGHKYGIAKEEIESIWEEGRIAIKPVDINGAKAIKAAFPDRTLTLFVRRDKEELLKCLIEREIPISEKTKRILSLDNEYANEAFCDWTISNNGSLEHAVEQVLRLV